MEDQWIEAAGLVQGPDLPDDDEVIAGLVLGEIRAFDGGGRPVQDRAAVRPGCPAASAGCRVCTTGSTTTTAVAGARENDNWHENDFRGVWRESELTPVELLHRNFRFCLLDEPSIIPLVDRIGTGIILYETDFPHGDGSWPDSQLPVDQHVGGLSEDVQRKVRWQNAAELYRLDFP